MIRQSIVFGVILAVTGCAAPRPNSPSQLLGNPVLDARRALANGDSMFVGILDGDIRLPGTSATADAERGRGVRTFSRRSLGLSADGWIAQRDSLSVYAAAYNTLVQEARDSAARRVP